MPRSYGVTNAAPYAAAPPVGASGDTYYNSTDKNLYLSDGTQWNAIQSGGASAATSYFYGNGSPTGSGNMTAGQWNAASWTLTAAVGMSLLTAQRIQVSAAGRYMVTAWVGLYASANAYTRSDLGIASYTSVGAAKDFRRIMGNASPVGNNYACNGGAVLDLAANDYITIWVMPTVAGVQFDFGGQYSWVEVTPVGGVKGDTGASGSATAVAPPYVSLRKSTTTALTANAFNTIAMDTVVDGVTGVDYTLANGQVTVVSAGYYSIKGYASTQSAIAGATRGYTVIFNGAGVALARSAFRVQDTAWSSQVDFQGWLAAGTVIYLSVWTDTAFTLPIIAPGNTADAYNPSLTIVREGGATGAVGATGPAGAQGQNVGFASKGEWASTTSYVPMDVVTRNGVAFVAMSANNNIDPGTLPAGSFAAIGDLQALFSSVGKLLPWTPNFRQGVTLTYTLGQAWYARVGEWVLLMWNVAFTSAGTGGQFLQMDLPVQARAVSGGASALALGQCFLYSGSNQYPLALDPNVSYTQFAIGASYYSTAIASGHSLTGFAAYVAPVGV